MRLTFSEPIDANTFDISDIVSFDGPEGPLSVLAVTPVPTSNRQFDLSFDPQSALGDYALVVGPHIADLAGNELDQNGDGFFGVDGDDNYSATFSIGNSFVFESSDVPRTISGLNLISSLLTVTQDVPIEDINVALNLSFPRVGKLDVWLVSPAGTTVMLSDTNGGMNPNFTDTIFDDQAEVAIADGTAPFTGTFRPDDPLALFNTQNARGTWQLNIQNVTTKGNLGSLNSWSIEVTKGESTGEGDGDPNDPPAP